MSSKYRKCRLKVWISSAIGLGLLGLLGSCTLLNLSETVPYGFDFTGTWVLDETVSDVAPDLKQIGKQERNYARRGKRYDPIGSTAFAVQDFPVIVSDQLIIEQDDSSIAIKYSEGSYRDYRWGEQKRIDWDIAAGWKGPSLVVIAKRNRTSGIEQMNLEDRGTTLRVEVSIKTNKDNLNLERVFRKN